jgi:hypothetical protein
VEYISLEYITLHRLREREGASWIGLSLYVGEGIWRGDFSKNVGDHQKKKKEKEEERSQSSSTKLDESKNIYNQIATTG